MTVEYLNGALANAGGATWHAVNANSFSVQSTTLTQKMFTVLFHGDGSYDNYDTSTIITPNVTWALEIKGTTTGQGKCVSASVSEVQDPDLGTYYNITVTAPQSCTIDGYYTF